MAKNINVEELCLHLKKCNDLYDLQWMHEHIQKKITPNVAVGLAIPPERKVEILQITTIAKLYNVAIEYTSTEQGGCNDDSVAEYAECSSDKSSDSGYQLVINRPAVYVTFLRWLITIIGLPECHRRLLSDLKTLVNGRVKQFAVTLYGSELIIYLIEVEPDGAVTNELLENFLSIVDSSWGALCIQALAVMCNYDNFERLLELLKKNKRTLATNPQSAKVINGILGRKENQTRWISYILD